MREKKWESALALVIGTLACMRVLIEGEESSTPYFTESMIKYAPRAGSPTPGIGMKTVLKKLPFGGKGEKTHENLGI